MKPKLRSVNTRFWDDSFVLELNPSEKLLFLYLLTNPLTTLLGIYEISEKRISFDTGLNKDTIRKAFKSFAKDKKVFFTDDNYIILPNFLKNQSLNSNMKKGVLNEFNLLPNELKDNILGNGSQSVSNDYQTVLNGIVKYEREVKREGEIESEDNYNKLFEKINLEVKLAEDFKEQILLWLKYKSEKGQSYKETGMRALIKSLLKDSNNNIEIATNMINNSIKNNYSGIFKSNITEKEKEEIKINYDWYKNPERAKRLSEGK